jgi:hypothetical protein
MFATIEDDMGPNDQLLDDVLLIALEVDPGGLSRGERLPLQ